MLGQRINRRRPPPKLPAALADRTADTSPSPTATVKPPAIASRRKRSNLWEIEMPGCGHTCYSHAPADQTTPPRLTQCYICHPPPQHWHQTELPLTGRGKRLTK